MNQLTLIEKCSEFICGLETKFTAVSSENQTELQFKQESQFAIQLLQSNDYLLKVAQNNQDSLKHAIINIGAIGLTLNAIKKLAYLIPRKGQICLDVSYMGLVDIACESGSIKFVQAKLVYENDTFEYLGISKEPLHTFSPFKPRGEFVGVYCVAKTNEGDFLTEIMTDEDIYAIRARSESYKKNGTGPWASDFSEMAKKTTIRRAYKLWPKNKASTRIEHAINALNEVEGIDFEKEEAEKVAARERVKKDDKEKRQKTSELIDEIMRLSGEKCKGLDSDAKMSFMQNVLGVDNFNDLKKKNNEDLEKVINEIKEV